MGSFSFLDSAYLGSDYLVGSPGGCSLAGSLSLARTDTGLERSFDLILPPILGPPAKPLTMGFLSSYFGMVSSFYFFATLTLLAFYAPCFGISVLLSGSFFWSSDLAPPTDLLLLIRAFISCSFLLEVWPGVSALSTAFAALDCAF